MRVLSLFLLLFLAVGVGGTAVAVGSSLDPRCERPAEVGKASALVDVVDAEEEGQCEVESQRSLQQRWSWFQL